MSVHQYLVKPLIVNMTNGSEKQGIMSPVSQGTIYDLATNLYLVAFSSENKNKLLISLSIFGSTCTRQYINMELVVTPAQYQKNNR